MISRFECRAFFVIMLLWSAPHPSTAFASEYQWWNKMIGATKANQIKLGNGNGVIVGVLDGLADYDLGAFGGRLHPWLNPDGTYTNFDLHATHVSGIIGAGPESFTAGIAPGVQISNFAVFDDFGFVGTTAAGLGQVHADGATVANMSYGPTTPGLLAFSDDLQAISSFSNSLVVTKAADNNGVNLQSEVFNGPLKNLIIVGAVDKNKKIASFSNRPGDGCFLQFDGASCQEANKYKYQFLVAPGKNILSLSPITDGAGNATYQFMSGTSMAAPMVAGAAALLQSHWAFLKTQPATTANILFATAQDLGKKGVDPVYGRGLLRIDLAMKAYGKTSFAVGPTVSGQSFNTSSGGLRLSSAFGTGANLVSALNGIVVFDSFGRDFNVDPHAVVGTQSAGLLLSRQVDSSFDMSQRGPLVSLQMSNGLAFTGVLPQAHDDTLEFSSAGETGLPAYLDATNDERRVWRVDGNFNSLSFSFGQRADMAPEAVSDAANLFLLNSEAQPLLALGEQTLFGFGRYKLADGLGLGMGFTETNVATGFEKAPGEGRAFVVQADYAVTQGLGLQFSQTFLTEDGTTLGSFSGGALAFGSEARTLASGGTISYKFLPNTTVRATFTTATTESNPSTVSLLRNVGTIESRSYGMSLTHKGVLGQSDEIGLSVNKPLRISDGEATVDAPVGRTVEGDVIYKHQTVSLAPEGSETDFDLGYRAAVTPALGFGVNLFYQNELNHDPNQSNVGVFSQMRFVY